MEGFDYRMFDAGDDQGGAIMPVRDRPGSGLIVYFDTDDIDASIAKVARARRQRRRQAAGADARLVRRVQGHGGQQLQPLAGRRERRLSRAHRGRTGGPRRPRGVGAGRGDGPLRRARRRDRGADVLDGDPARCSRLAILLVARGGFGGLGGAFRTPAWMWLGGLMGLTVVFSITFAQPRIGATATIGILIAGQLVMGAVIDRFGLFGVEQIGISPYRAASGSCCWESARHSRSFGSACEPPGEGLDRARHGLRDLGLDVPRHLLRGRDDPAALRGVDAVHRRGHDHGAASCSLRGGTLRISRARARARASLIGFLLPGANAVLFFAERNVPTGLASLIIASVPLWVVVLRLARTRAAAVAGAGRRRRRLRRRRGARAAVGRRDEVGHRALRPLGGDVGDRLVPLARA